MRIAIVTLFPGMFSALSQYGISGRAVRNSLLQLKYVNPRDYATDKHRTVDDRPYGGGPGMVMKTGPLGQALAVARSLVEADSSEADGQIETDLQGSGQKRGAKVIYLSPQGKPLTQAMVKDLAKEDGMVLLCGRYEGIDERVLTTLVDEEYSLGDFVLSGGEIPAMALLDAVTRLLEGALGDAESAVQDSFSNGLLDHPHFTRPEEFAGLHVPDILLSGDHAKIAKWRLQQQLGATWRKRPDLLENMQLTSEEQALLDDYISGYRASE